MTVSYNNVQVQKQGLVELSYGIGPTKYKTDFEMMKKIQILRESLPIKHAVVHVCTDDSTTRYFMKLAKPILSILSISRIRFHFGRYIEVQYELLSCGIPLGALPVDSNGTCNNIYQQIWVNQRLEIEQEEKRQQEQEQQEQQKKKIEKKIYPLNTISKAETTTLNINMMLDDKSAATADTIASLSSTTALLSMSSKKKKIGSDVTTSKNPKTNTFILQPTPNDCILGRGRAIDQHVGNVQFRNFLSQDVYMTEYKNSGRHTKGRLAQRIKKILEEEHDVRFLKETTAKNNGAVYSKGYELANDAAIKEKITRTFRRILLNNKPT